MANNESREKTEQACYTLTQPRAWVEFAQKQIATITLNWNYLKMVWIKNKRHGHLGINFNYFKCSSANSPRYSFLSLSGIVWQTVFDMHFTIHGQKARSDKTCDNRFQCTRNTNNTVDFDIIGIYINILKLKYRITDI